MQAGRFFMFLLLGHEEDFLMMKMIMMMIMMVVMETDVADKLAGVVMQLPPSQSSFFTSRFCPLKKLSNPSAASPMLLMDIQAGHIGSGKSHVRPLHGR